MLFISILFLDPLIFGCFLFSVWLDLVLVFMKWTSFLVSVRFEFRSKKIIKFEIDFVKKKNWIFAKSIPNLCIFFCVTRIETITFENISRTQIIKFKRKMTVKFFFISGYSRGSCKPDEWSEQAIGKGKRKRMRAV